MNAFYERLSHFAELVKDASQNEMQNYTDYFTVQHPPYPIVSYTRSVMPKLMFHDCCTVTMRQKIRNLLKKSFNRIKNKE